MAKNIKKLFALILAVSMVMSLSVNAFAGNGIVVCEKETHTHALTCYEQTCPTTEEDNDLTCVKGEHEHTEACHVHGESCGEACTITPCAIEVHTHNDECYTSHTHVEACYDLEKLNCDLHAHDESCYTKLYDEELNVDVEAGDDGYTFMSLFRKYVHGYEFGGHFMGAGEGPQTFVVIDTEAYDNKTWSPDGLYEFGESNYEVVYCCDVETMIKDGTYYKRMNLEDSEYYGEEEAAKIRAIVTNAYPYVSLEQMKQNLAKDGFAYAAELTRNDVIAAVQCAIWASANEVGAEDLRYAKSYRVSDNLQWGYPMHDISNASGLDVAGLRVFETYPKVGERIDALVDYLLAQDKAYADKNQVVISNMKIVDSVPVMEKEGVYTVALQVELNNSGSSKRDDIQLMVYVGDDCVKTVDVKLGTEIYDLIVEAEAGATIKAVVDGTQILPEGVYFYAPKPADVDPDEKDDTIGPDGIPTAREVSQNLVGVAAGATPVHAEAEVTLPADEVPVSGTLQLQKVNEDGEALTGAAFDLYFLLEDKPLYIDTYSVDANGQLTVDGLMPGSYELVETTVPQGYVALEETVAFAIGEDGALIGADVADGVLTVVNALPDYKVFYEYIGNVPENAPATPDEATYKAGASVTIADEPEMDGFRFFGWNTDALVDGKMPANNVVITGYWMEDKDPSIGNKTTEEINPKDNSYEVKIEVPGTGDGLHDEVILMIDGTVSYNNNVPAWEATKKAILGVAETVLDGTERTQLTLLSFGMSDNVFATGITDIDELAAMLPEDSFGLLYGVSASNFESSFSGIEEYIQLHNSELNDVRVVCISNGGLNYCDIPMAFDNRDTYFWMTDKEFVNNALNYSLLYELNSESENTDALFEVFGTLEAAQAAYADYKNGVKVEEFQAQVIAWHKAVFDEVYEAAGMVPGVSYPVSDVEHAFLDYDNANGTFTTYLPLVPLLNNYTKNVASEALMKERTIAAAEKVAAMDIVSEMYVVQHGSDRRADWMQKIAGSNYFHYNSLDALLDNMESFKEELAVTNYKNIVVTDYMSKWVNLDTDTVRVMNDTTGETVWSAEKGWLVAEEARPTTQETPVIIEKISPVDYDDGGEDVVGNESGDIYKLTWYVKDDALLRIDTYSLRYIVTVDTQEPGFKPGTNYPANGDTSVTYEDENGKPTGNEIKVPTVKVPAYTVTYISRGKTVQKTMALITGEAIPGCADPASYTNDGYRYDFEGWKLTEGTEGPDGTIGTTDLVYVATFDGTVIPVITPVGPKPKDDIDIPDETPPLAEIPELFGDDHFAYIIGRDDGLVHPEANITRAEVATIFFRLLAEEVRTVMMTDVNNFSDVDKGQWYNHAISTLASMGIVFGRDDGSYYDPDAFITRAEFAAIAARFDPTGNPEGEFFSDIAGHWAEREIIIAANNGWVHGYNGLFRPDDYITRAEAMTLVNNVLHRLPETEHDLLDYMVIWPDNMDVNAWYYLAVQEATNSHFYVRKTNPVYETWTEFREPYDWSLLEY